EPWTGPVFVSPKIPDLAATVRGLLGKATLVGQPSARSLNIVTPLGTDALGEIVEQGLDPSRSVGIDALLTGEIVSIAATPMTLGEIRRGAAGLILAGGHKPAVIRDTPGLVAQRVAAMIVAVGYAMLDKGVASAADIDIAATQALGYAQGPFALSGRIGAVRSVQILPPRPATRGVARGRGPTTRRPGAWRDPRRGGGADPRGRPASGHDGRTGRRERLRPARAAMPTGRGPAANGRGARRHRRCRPCPG
ncbi:MAG: 3-hydroxyacyl-CoA dehydrogenase family protein, partial [Hyphomicrobiales bacterium]